MHVRCVVLGALAALGACSAAPADLIVNGGFEQTTGATPDSWTATGNLAVIGSQGVSEGVRAVAFSFGNVASNGSLEQEFATTPGTTYSLRFDFGKFSVNQPSQVASLDVDVFDSTTIAAPGGPSLLSLSVLDDTPGPGNSAADATVYDSYAFTFVASGSQATLRFLDVSDAQVSGGGFDAMLDNVSISAIPEPATPVLGLTLLALRAARPRRTRRG